MFQILLEKLRVMDYQSTNMDEKEISLVDLFMYLLRRYRSIVLVAAVCGLVVCAGAFVKARYLSKPEDYVAYEREMMTYKTDQNLLSIYENKLNEANRYLVESPLINVENYSLPTATVSMCVEGTYSELFSNSTSYDPGDSIANNIVLSIEKGTDWKALGEKYGIDSKYIKELVSVSLDLDSNIVLINTVGPTEDVAKGLLDNIREQVNNNLSSILDSYRGYYIKERNYNSYIDTGWVNDIEETTRNSINEYITQIDALEKKYSGKGEPQAPDYFSVLRGVKYFLIGGVVGGVAMAAVYCVIYLLNDCIREEDELCQYYGFANLGTFSVKQNKAKANKFDNYLLKKQYGESDDEYVYGRISENIELISKKDEKVLLIGTVEGNKLEELYSKLNSSVNNCKLILGGNINSDNEALGKLKDADSVILVEQRNVSRNKDINKEIGSVKNCDKKVLGYIQY